MNNLSSVRGLRTKKAMYEAGENYHLSQWRSLLITNSFEFLYHFLEQFWIFI